MNSDHIARRSTNRLSCNHQSPGYSQPFRNTVLELTQHEIGNSIGTCKKRAESTDGWSEEWIDIADLDSHPIRNHQRHTYQLL